MKMNNTLNPWKTKSRRQVYENNWITVEHHEVIDPSGKDGIYGKVHFKNLAVGILPIDDDGYTWIVGQYRYAQEQNSWEIPEGGALIGEDPLDAAKRELREEAGIIAENWSLIQELDLSNSVTDERAMIYVAKGLSFCEQELESTEDITLKKIPFSELVTMVNNNQIRDSITVAAVLKYQLSFMAASVV